MALFGQRFQPFGGPQFGDPEQSAQAAMMPQYVVARALMGPLGANQGGVRTAQDARDIAARGAVDPTLANLGQMLNTGMGFMGGTGILKSMAKYGLSQLTDKVTSPFTEPTGFAKPSPGQLASITQGGPQQMQNQARRMAEKAHADKKEAEARAKEARAESGRMARGV